MSRAAVCEASKAWQKPTGVPDLMRHIVALCIATSDCAGLVDSRLYALSWPTLAEDANKALRRGTNVTTTSDIRQVNLQMIQLVHFSP